MKLLQNSLKKRLPGRFIARGGVNVLNEIILNGKSSSELQGLIIQSLPPVVKPQIRTQIEEIDGRDGDIVTKLGFAAYDKSFDIGLSYDFDIDDIIAFFNREGTVTFSNEPDKYYNYQILNQIDFERLIRFRTATVTMHVQPFKYSCVETMKTYTVVNRLLSFNDYTRTINGITLTASNGSINISGTGTAATEFYLPINAVRLNPGSYTFSALGGGTSVSACSIRLIYDSPSNANSFGGKYVTLQNNTTLTISTTLNEVKTYNYLYFYIAPNTAMDFNLNLNLINNAGDSFTISNNGNYISKPIMTIYGSGTINLSLNDVQIFVIQLGDEEYITIDSGQLEAYKDGTLKNRLVTGNYENFVLNVGKNEISWTGDVEEFEVENYSRWI